MIAIVDGLIRLDPNDAPHLFRKELGERLSFPNPEFTKRKKLGLWLGQTSETVGCVKRDDDGRLTMPRGSIQTLVRLGKSHGLSLKVDDRRIVRPVDWPDPAAAPKPVTPRPYQADCLVDMRRGVQGSIVIPCGGGKTTLGLLTAVALAQRTLVVVHTKDLLRQWRDESREKLGVEPGIWGGGVRKKTVGDQITIATIQTLVRLAELDEFGDQFGTVIVDEAHHAPASTWQQVLAAMPARYRFGLTATPERADGLSPLLDFTCGDRLFEIGYPPLIAAGYLEAPEIVKVLTSFRYHFKKPKEFDKMADALIACRERNEQIAEIAGTEASEGRTVLVLTGRVEHCETLAAMISARGVEAASVTGDPNVTPPSERKRSIERFKAGELRVVIATQLADEGLDVPRLSRLLLVFPTRAKGRTTQRVGRALRLHPDKETAGVKIYDFVDGKVYREESDGSIGRPLVWSYRSRMQVYRTFWGDPAESQIEIPTPAPARAEEPHSGPKQMELGPGWGRCKVPDALFFTTKTAARIRKGQVDDPIPVGHHFCDCKRLKAADKTSAIVTVVGLTFGDPIRLKGSQRYRAVFQGSAGGRQVAKTCSACENRLDSIKGG